MGIIYLLVPLSLLLLGAAIWAFFWAVDNGQFDDLDSPALSILQDDDDRNLVSKALTNHSGEKMCKRDEEISQ